MGINGVDLIKEQKGESGSLSADVKNTSPQHESSPADKGVEHVSKELGENLRNTAFKHGRGAHRGDWGGGWRGRGCCPLFQESGRDRAGITYLISRENKRNLGQNRFQ